MTHLNTGIYEIRNTTNGKRYVGSAISFDTRFRAHLNDLRKDKHPNRHLQFAWNKYGEESFQIGPIIICSVKDLLFYEQIILDTFYDSLYNLAPTAGSQLGFRFSKESRLKMSITRTGQSIILPPRTKEHSLAISKANTGKTQSLKTRQKRSDSMKGKNLGRKASDQAKKNISDAKKGCIPWNKGKTGVYSADTLARISVTSTGRVFSPKSRQKMADSRKGKPNGFQGKHHTPEALDKIAAAGRKQVQSRETRQKRSDSIKRWHAERKAQTKPVRIPYL